MNLQNRHGFAPFENSSATVNWDTGGFFAETVDIGKLMKRKSPEANLRLQYKKTFELSLIFTLAILIATFQVARQFSLAPSELKNANVTIEVADIPPTEQIRNLPTPPARPTVPVPTESELVPEDITIQSTNLDLSELPPPPAPPVKHRYEQYNFIPYDEAPEPIGGYGVILANLEYPTIAQKAGIEARVLVGVLIDERGNCVNLFSYIAVKIPQAFLNVANDFVIPQSLDIKHGAQPCHYAARHLELVRKHAAENPMNEQVHGPLTEL
ncbi:hypothetical protein IH824_17805 [candidate division KSB1 bacterium]|nr:hypothetical protein [candidate division KSB1 bacterium]